MISTALEVVEHSEQHVDAWYRSKGRATRLQVRRACSVSSPVMANKLITLKNET
jgi:hypothetical protein